MNTTTLALAGILAIAASSPACNGADDPSPAAVDGGAPSDAAPPRDAAADESSDAPGVPPKIVSTAVF
jgi:hypothetical protein